MGKLGLANRTTCALCDSEVDPLRDRACVVDGRVQTVCSACAAGSAWRTAAVPGEQRGHGRAGTASRRGACSECGDLVELHRLQPVVKASGSVASLCPACVDGRERPVLEPVEEPAGHDAAPAALSAGWRRYGLAALAAAGLVVATASARDRMPTAAVANSFAPAAQAASHTGDRDLGARGAAVSDELGELLDPPAEPGAEPAPGTAEQVGDIEGIEGELDEDLGDGELEDPGVFDNELPPTIEDVLENSGEPLEERLPTLLDWVHPVAGSDEGFPLKSTRRFGAQRDGVKRTECGRGHCGVDLDGPRGTPVVAVAWGEVARIERRSGRRSGKYVRIEHPDYVYTSYMHLDSIAAGLEVGDEVQPGDILGTLGRTGIRNSAAHLHFSLEIPRGDRFEHFDPTPYLRKAARIDQPNDSPDHAEIDE